MNLSLICKNKEIKEKPDREGDSVEEDDMEVVDYGGGAKKEYEVGSQPLVEGAKGDAYLSKAEEEEREETQDDSTGCPSCVYKLMEENPAGQQIIAPA